MKKMIAIAMTAGMLALAGLALADHPARNVSWKKHRNLAAAQTLVMKAFQKIEAAQKANEFDMDGHAQKAKDLLDQVNMELKAAAEEANHPH